MIQLEPSKKLRKNELLELGSLSTIIVRNKPLDSYGGNLWLVGELSIGLKENYARFLNYTVELDGMEFRETTRIDEARKGYNEILKSMLECEKHLPSIPIKYKVKWQFELSVQKAKTASNIEVKDLQKLLKVAKNRTTTKDTERENIAIIKMLSYLVKLAQSNCNKEKG